MLKLKIDPPDLPGPWEWIGRWWASGASWIEPYDHPALECHRVADGETTRLVVAEQVPGRTGIPVGDWPGDVIEILICPAGAEIVAGTRAVAPIYLTDSAGVLRGPWDLPELRSWTQPGQDGLVDREAARLLGIRFRYGHDTIFPGIVRLTERAAARCGDAGQLIRRPLRGGQDRAPGTAERPRRTHGLHRDRRR